MLKKIFSKITRKFKYRFRLGNSREKLERGQILIIVTLSLIGLVAVVGMTVDVGLLYASHGKLRRSVDAAALAASSQYREGYDIADLTSAAKEFLVLNGFNDSTAIVETCDSTRIADPPDGDPILCDDFDDNPRKQVRVHASAVVDLAFLPVVGIHHVTINAKTISEAASMDVIFVIDSSDSMTWDLLNTNPMFDPSQCNPGNNCLPFREVKDAAQAFVDELYFPYDRVSLVTFDVGGQVETIGGVEGFSDDYGDISNAISALEVFEGVECTGPHYFTPIEGPCREYERYCDCVDDPAAPTTCVPEPHGGLEWEFGNCNNVTYDEDIVDFHAIDGTIGTDGVIDYYEMKCPIGESTGIWDTCGNTSIASGLALAGQEFVDPATFRKESLWVVILLTDGAANGPKTFCPLALANYVPYCRDEVINSRHCTAADATSCLIRGNCFLDDDDCASAGLPGGTYNTPLTDYYDADDFARDMVDYIADDQQALIFSIGLGPQVKGAKPRVLKADLNVKCTTEDLDDCFGAGEQMLRYAAKYGDGLYYHAPTGAELQAIFLEIAGNLATRLTQ